MFVTCNFFHSGQIYTVLHPTSLFIAIVYTHTFLRDVNTEAIPRDFHISHSAVSYEANNLKTAVYRIVRVTASAHYCFFQDAASSNLRHSATEIHVQS